MESLSKKQRKRLMSISSISAGGNDIKSNKSNELNQVIKFKDINGQSKEMRKRNGSHKFIHEGNVNYIHHDKSGEVSYHNIKKNVNKFSLMAKILNL